MQGLQHERGALRQAILGLTLGLAPCLAHAGLRDEITVFDDELLGAGERDYKLHFNRTPSPRSDETAGQLRVMHELAWGVGRDLELGLHLPTVRNPNGEWTAAGTRLRLKWLPIGAHAGNARHDANGQGTWFAGGNVEISQLRTRYENPPGGFEFRGILGWRGGPWLFAFNPLLSRPLTHQPSQTTKLRLAMKAMREVGHDVAVGVEYYIDRGPLSRPLPREQQDRTLYLVTNFPVGSAASMHLGLGRGTTRGSDAWTFKSVIGFPF